MWVTLEGGGGVEIFAEGVAVLRIILHLAAGEFGLPGDRAGTAEAKLQEMAVRAGGEGQSDYLAVETVTGPARAGPRRGRQRPGSAGGKGKLPADAMDGS